MSRRQLEFEARQIRSAMEEQLGSCQEMERRAQARVSRIQQIEKDILRLGARLQVTSDAARHHTHTHTLPNDVALVLKNREEQDCQILPLQPSRSHEVGGRKQEAKHRTKAEVLLHQNQVCPHVLDLMGI